MATASRSLPGLGLTGFWALGENGWNGANDTNLRLLSALVQCRVISRKTALPAVPNDGDIYVVPSDAAANGNAVAIRDAGAWIYVAPTAGFLVYVKDDAVLALFDGDAWGDYSPGGGGGSGAYDIPLSYAGGPPEASEVLWRVIIPRAVAFAADFAGSAGWVGTNPTDSFEISVQVDGAEIGTITIGTDASFAFATTGGAAQTAGAGSRLEFVAPATADATVTDISATLFGTESA